MTQLSIHSDDPAHRSEIGKKCGQALHMGALGAGVVDKYWPSPAQCGGKRLGEGATRIVRAGRQELMVRN